MYKITLLFLAFVTFSLGSRFPAQSHWCGNCKFPRPFVNYTETLTKLYDSDKPSTCGDGVCNIFAGETCESCAGDCGECTGEVFKGCKNPKHIALTFDDGPSPYDNKLLDILQSKGVKATFFHVARYVSDGASSAALGNDKNGWSNGYPEKNTMNRIIKDGHSYGSHTFRHKSLTELSNATETVRNGMLLDILGAELTFFDVLEGMTPKTIRPPFLELDNVGAAYLKTLGYNIIQVNKITNDTTFSDSDSVNNKTATNLILESAKVLPHDSQGPLILMHSTLSDSVDAVASIIENFQQQNYEFVDLETCTGLSKSVTQIKEDFSQQKYFSTCFGTKCKKPDPLPSVSQSKDSDEQKRTSGSERLTHKNLLGLFVLFAAYGSW